MRRLAAGGLVALSTVVLLSSCSTLKTPTEPTAATSSGFGISATVAASVASLADCLGGSQSSACFSGPRVLAQGVFGAPATIPVAPSNLVASASGSSVTLTWRAPSSGDPMTAYVIEAGSAPGLANLAAFSTGNTLTVFQASGVGAGTYYVRVRAANRFGTSGPSNETILVVGGSSGVAPGAPSGLTNTVNAGGTVGFAWNAASGSPTTYVIEAGSRSGLSNLANSDLGSASTTMTATGVGAGTYYVRVRAKNAFGISAPSNEVVLVVGALGCNPNLSPTGMNVSGAYVATAAVGPSKGLAVTFVFQRYPGSDVLWDVTYSDTAGRRGAGGLAIDQRPAVHPRVELHIGNYVPSPDTDGAVFLGDLSACSGNTVLEFTGEVHMGYIGSRPCQPGESCPGGDGYYHFIGPGYPMTLTRR